MGGWGFDGIEIRYSRFVPVGKFWLIHGRTVEMHPVDGWALWREMNTWITAAV